MTAEELVAFAEELARVAAGGGGAKGLAERLSRAVDAAILVEDARWRRVAAAGKDLPASVRPLLADERTDGYLTLRDGRAGRSLRITAGDAFLGRLSLFATNGLDAAELPARLCAGSIGVELAREAGTGTGRRETFWESLAASAYSDAAAARDDAHARGIALATHYLAVALEVPSADESAQSIDGRSLRAEASALFRSADADVGMLERGGALLLFVPAPREVDAANARTAATLFPRTLAKKHAQLRLCAGVGGRVPAANVAQSIEQAQIALTIARRLHGYGKTAVYDELGVYPILLSGAGPAAMREFSARTLAPLRAYDEKHQTELERTLRLYFSVGENVKTAAAQLNVHRHTVFYRLRQIGEICGCAFDNPHDQLTLRTAMAIDALNP